MIVVENLTKRYGDRTAVNQVSFNVSKGEVIGFLGPNGAGKSTTMRMLTGFLSPTAGKIVIGGHDMAEETLQAKQLLGYLPETPPLYTDMTVKDYLDFVGQLKGLNSTQRKQRLDYVLEKCYLKDRTNQVIQQLSKGYKQRVGIAQALIHNPPVLILDEPTSGLDPAQIIQIRDLIKELAHDHTIILSTHILPEVQSTCSRVLIISSGKLVAEGPPEQLDAQLRGGMHVSLTVRGPVEAIRRDLLTVPGVAAVTATEKTEFPGLTQIDVQTENDADVREALASRVVSGGWGLVEMKSVSLSLEEIFLKLTTQESPATKEAANV